MFNTSDREAYRACKETLLFRNVKDIFADVYGKRWMQTLLMYPFVYLAFVVLFVVLWWNREDTPEEEEDDV